MYSGLADFSNGLHNCLNWNLLLAKIYQVLELLASEIILHKIVAAFTKEINNWLVAIERRQRISVHEHSV